MAISNRGESDVDPKIKAARIGIDLSGLPPFPVYGENEQGQLVIETHFSREKLAEYFANVSPCTVGIAIDPTFASTAQYWKRKIESHHHRVILMSLEYVQTHGQGGFNAQAICKAVKRTVG